ncbi:YafY family transcriptional regulator [Tessaracoccus sp. OS52]|uniref:helix-turn-helix transcriptional regulator n=1 Tax=Tessaracoccus sp. OS52 TaxID=2886691 RepID=UPI001D0F72FA|nr:YafY family protein [Tessaracoccus sp. OS52]MCC2593563.1 YafY family transcriptional regulator [Tessaracoccus sp. OS52]
MANPSGRLLELLSLLQARRDWPGEGLARRLGVSPRTVRRDVDRLRELGYPVQTTKGPAGGYRLAPGLDLPPLLFDDDQAVAVAVALQTISTDVAGLRDASDRALATIRQVLPSRLRHRVDALQVTALDRDGAPDEQVRAETLLHIGACCRDHEVLRFDYVSRDGSATLRRAEPYRLVSRGRRWYLLAWDLERVAWRTFRVDRLSPRTPNGPRFRPREVSEELLAEHFHQEPAAPWPATGTVVLQAPAHEVTRWLRGDRATVTAITEGACRVELGAWSYGSLAAMLLMFETDFDVVEPPELKAALAALGARVARAAS